MSVSDEWFAWYPVKLGALGRGGWAWWRKVWRNRCMGVTIYQDLEWVKSLDKNSAEVFDPYLSP